MRRTIHGLKLFQVMWVGEWWQWSW